jgi:uncharacterized integral membrane protein (TIGR00698 family)
MATVSKAKEKEQSKSGVAGLLVGLALIVILAVLTDQINGLLNDYFRQQLGEKMKNPLEYPLWAALLGLTANAILRLTRTYDFVKPAVRTELFLKIGLVLLGTRVLFGDILSKGLGGLIQAIIMVTSVFFFTWWLAGKLKVEDKLRALMSTAVSICGVSAAIAAAGAVLAKKEQIAYITTLVIVTALPLMVIMPLAANAMGLPPEIAGAWFGGNIDTTAAVVGAGTMYGEKAQEVASIVKMAQNALIGVAAFLLALYFVMGVERKPDERPSPRIIWDRFPKFVLGFVLASVLASIGFFTKEQLGALNSLSTWAFTLAFVCIGLELSLGEFKLMGWRPIVVYLTATLFNTLLALAVASIIFGWLAV